MYKKRVLLLSIGLLCFSMIYMAINERTVIEMEQYTFPAEDKKHEGTWLTWPHHYTYGIEYRKEIEEIWVSMTQALHSGEIVHIIAYNQIEQDRIKKILMNNKIDMHKIDFVIAKSDDVWSRDTGPMFVRDKNDQLVIADFKFDGWGKKTPYKKDDKIPQVIASSKKIPHISISDFVLEGGSIELDGRGTAMLTKSSVVSKNRNKDMSLKEVEEYLSHYLGITHFIWLDGALGEDITDAHIDGMARFSNEQTLLTINKNDFLDMYETIEESDYDILMHATNADGEEYEKVIFPMTAKNVDGLDYKGSYLNFYIGNEVVLVPTYNDINDKIALDMISKLYPTKKIVSIDVRNLYQYGGMLHCITQQQPQ